MDLRQFLIKSGSGRCTRPLADALGEQLLKGIAHMHKTMLVHRDLKPANLLLYFTAPDPRDTAGSMRVCLKACNFRLSCVLTGQRLRAKASFPKV